MIDKQKRRAPPRPALTLVHTLPPTRRRRGIRTATPPCCGAFRAAPSFAGGWTTRAPRCVPRELPPPSPLIASVTGHHGGGRVGRSRPAAVMGRGWWIGGGPSHGGLRRRFPPSLGLDLRGRLMRAVVWLVSHVLFIST